MLARRAMTLARAPCTDGTRADLIHREQRPRLVRAARPVPRAHEALRLVGAAQMRRAVRLAIHGAYRLMRRADGLAAAGTLRHLVHAHRLLGAALTVLQARRTQAAASLRRRRVALLCVPVAHDPAAVAARRETRGAGRVPVPLGAETLVRRAVLQPARRADAHVLVTRRLSIHPALGDAVVRAEVLGAYRATVRARLAGAVVVPADDKHRRWATALRARHAPGRRTGRAQGPLGAEGGVMPAGRGRLEPPLGALYQDVGLDQL